MKKSLLLCATLLLTACVQITETGYYWGNYSETYYQYIKSPSEATVTDHLASLQDIIHYSAEKGLKVPPGIYAELGYIYAQRGETQQANSMYAKEAELYPESAKFLQGLVTKEQA
ncbi:DUF4810 domain-containing protein [Shewanella sp. NIFS-20-20]|uniref:DUF4810 domain-containing protein n=1 Tax=Shewanella sp. NIFS-20-20 TaxID=2853806 RepID=UPI001C43CA76|nr:DUF4810 domain-containing protein [Shewanella sp. NIFS-20-20]MBV7316545.1 DUF4810 domain-containing protein [Shewanella sp. NIFS-20-20]